MIEIERLNLSLASLWIPDYLVSSAWLAHAPFAFWLVERIKPRRFVELGTHQGFSFFTFCQAIARLELGTTAFAVDTWKGDEHAGHYGEEVFTEVALQNVRYAAFSTLMRSTFDDALGYFEDHSIDLLHIDGRHHYEDVRNDYERWLPKLTDDAVVLFHDVNVRERDFGVWRFFGELSQHHPSFQFVHGHGLGVLCLGGSTLEHLQGLLQASQEAADATRLAYATLGRNVVERQGEVSLRQALAHICQQDVDLSPEALASIASTNGKEVVQFGARLVAAREETHSIAADIARKLENTLRRAKPASPRRRRICVQVKAGERKRARRCG